MVRILHEVQMRASSCFITLTYDEAHLPENGSLLPADFTRFVKALRKGYAKREISFYGCGEYGDRSYRPHYHLIVCGPEKFFEDRYRGPDPSRIVWLSEELDDYWRMGLTEMGTVTAASASYVAGYATKKVRVAEQDEFYERVNVESGELIQVEPVFARMSLRPAIGRTWIEKYWTDVYPRDFVVNDGRERKPPRYYDKFMDFLDEDGGTQERRTIMEEVRDKRWLEKVELDKYTLAAKEAILRGRRGLQGGRDAV